MLVLLGGVMQVSAETTTTVYYAVPSSVVGSYSVKLKVNRQGDADNPATYAMNKTKKTYDGKYIYECTYTDLYDGVGYMLFQLWNGDTWISEDCGVGYKENGGIHWVWTPATTYNGKLHVHGDSSWKTYYTDHLKGSWDANEIEFEDGEATVNFATTGDKDFKVRIGNTLYGAQSDGATMFWNNSTNWTLDGGYDCHIQVSATGTYTFKIDPEKKISVTFPSYTPNEVYIYNNLNWASAPYAYVLTGSYWNNDKGSGSQNEPKGVVMTQIGTSNVWKAEYPAGANSGYIAFNKKQQDGYEFFSDTEAVYIENFNVNTPLYVPNTSDPINKNYYDNNSKWTAYWNTGEWHPFPTYTRSVTSGNFGTICLPYAATVTGATIFKITSYIMDGETLTGINIESVTDNAIEAGKAYIFKATGTTLTATYTGGSPSAATEAYGMMGNISSSSVPVATGKYIIKYNKIYKAASNVTCGQYKGYITLEGLNETNARGANFISFEDTTTGIANVDVDANIDVDAPMYNLAGQRVSKSYKGVVVVNGKKMLNK